MLHTDVYVGVQRIYFLVAVLLANPVLPVLLTGLVLLGLAAFEGSLELLAEGASLALPVAASALLAVKVLESLAVTGSRTVLDEALAATAEAVELELLTEGSDPLFGVALASAAESTLLLDEVNEGAPASALLFELANEAASPARLALNALVKLWAWSSLALAREVLGRLGASSVLLMRFLCVLLLLRRLLLMLVPDPPRAPTPGRVLCSILACGHNSNRCMSGLES